MTTEDQQSRQEQPEYKRGPIARVLSIFGILFPRRAKQWIILTRRFRILTVLSVVVLLGFIASFFFYFSSTPAFCRSCHFMEKYVDSWEGSTHNKNGCNDCHFPPGWRNVLRAKLASSSQVIKTLTGTHSSKPHAEIEDAACLRPGCHETRLLKGKVTFKKKYHFDHEPHLTKLRRGKKLRCTSCHSQIVQGSHISVTESVCFTCHFKGKMHERSIDPIAGCPSCHQPPDKEIVLTEDFTFDHKPFLKRDVACWKCHFDAIQGDGDVPQQVCLTCHAEPEKLAKRSDPTALHDWHVTQRKVECFRCHEEIRHGLHPEPYKRKGTCATCHVSGHDPATQIFAGQGAQGVKPSRGSHSLSNVDCVACHEMKLPSKGVAGVGTHKATEQACLACHGKRYKGKLAEWQSLGKETLDEAKEKLTQAQKAYDALPAGLPAKVKALAPLSRARHNYDLVAKGFVVHNLDYSLDVLEKVSKDADEAARIAKQATTKPTTNPN